MTDSAVKGAETGGLKGLVRGVIVSCARTLSTPPKQHVFRIWQQRNALTSGLSATFPLSPAVGLDCQYLEAYVQGIVDHLFQYNNMVVSVKDGSILALENMPLLERDRCEVESYVESILHTQNLLLLTEEGNQGTPRYVDRKKEEEKEKGRKGGRKGGREERKEGSKHTHRHPPIVPAERARARERERERERAPLRAWVRGWVCGCVFARD